MIAKEELGAVTEEAARRRELDRLMSISVSRDGLPLVWRRALRFMLFVVIVEKCERRDVGALPLLMAFLGRHGLPSLPESAKAQPGSTGRAPAAPVGVA